MGKGLYETNPKAKGLLDKANDIFGFVGDLGGDNESKKRITDIMFNGTDEDLKQTKVT